jgi:microsomal dipeptidase-like Zn-dependent dipeptidase
MYHHCLFCQSDLGTNNAVERFPVGRRLSFDAAKGRLGVVCTRCGRWNLTPLEERWEAIEECERLYRGTRLRASTDNIGLGTDMSIGTYPDHEHDPWGEPEGYKDVASAYAKHITADVRSPRRALDGFSNYPQVVNFIGKLKDRGYTDQDVSKVLGQNYLRVFDQVWR